MAICYVDTLYKEQRKGFMRLLPAVFAIAIAPLFSPATSTTAPNAFPVPDAGLTIPAREPSGWNLAQLLREYGRVTDQHFMIDEDARATLSHTRVSLDGELVVAPEALHSVVESILVQAGFFFVTVREASPRLIAVSTADNVSRALTRGQALFLSEDELESWSEHPAYIVQTVVSLDSLDVRMIANSLRGLISDANVQQVIPIGNSSGLLLKGPCPQVESLARLLRQMNELERASNAKMIPAETDK